MVGPPKTLSTRNDFWIQIVCCFTRFNLIQQSRIKWRVSSLLSQNFSNEENWCNSGSTKKIAFLFAWCLLASFYCFLCVCFNLIVCLFGVFLFVCLCGRSNLLINHYFKTYSISNILFQDTNGKTNWPAIVFCFFFSCSLNVLYLFFLFFLTSSSLLCFFCVSCFLLFFSFFVSLFSASKNLPKMKMKSQSVKTWASGGR